jgi:hypothetical protein
MISLFSSYRGSVAVTAFQAVWALEQKRRDNDRKVLALHLEIKQMMSVLRQCVFLASEVTFPSNPLQAPKCQRRRG